MFDPNKWIRFCQLMLFLLIYFNWWHSIVIYRLQSIYIFYVEKCDITRMWINTFHMIFTNWLKLALQYKCDIKATLQIFSHFFYSVRWLCACIYHIWLTCLKSKLKVREIVWLIGERVKHIVLALLISFACHFSSWNAYRVQNNILFSNCNTRYAYCFERGMEW